MNLFSGLKSEGLSRELHRWKAIERDIVFDDSGYYVYWPKIPKYGFLSQEDLLEIYQRLKVKNEPWGREIQKFFGEKGVK